MHPSSLILPVDVSGSPGHASAAASLTQHAGPPPEPARWDRFAAGHAQGSLYRRAAWLDLLRACFGHACFALEATGADGELTGILPLVRLKTPFFGDYLVSVPFFNYGGVLAESDAVAARLLVEGANLARELGCSCMELRQSAEQPVD